MKVTAVIPTVGRTETLPMVLHSLACQTWPVSDLIVLDEAARPVSESYVVNQAMDLLSLQGAGVKILRRRHRRGIAAARLELAAEARTELVLMVDDDVVLRPDCLQLLMEKRTTDFAWAVPYCFLVSAAFRRDGYRDSVVSKDASVVREWTARYPWFVPYFNYAEDFTQAIDVAGTQCILWNRSEFLEEAGGVEKLGRLPREDTYLTKVTGPGLFVSRARVDHFEDDSQAGRGAWESSVFYRMHTAVMEDPEGFLRVMGGKDG